MMEGGSSEHISIHLLTNVRVSKETKRAFQLCDDPTSSLMTFGPNLFFGIYCQTG